MKKFLNSFSDQPVTVLLVVAFIVAAAAGGVLVVIHPATLSFNEYLEQLAKLATALGILGVGRGIHAASKGRPKTIFDQIPLEAFGGTGFPSGTATSGAPQEDSPLGVGHAVEGRDDEEPGDDDLFPHIEESDPAYIPPDEGETQKLTESEFNMLASGAHSGSVSGLSAPHRKVVRAAVHLALNLSVAHSNQIGYTQGSQRWEWFHGKLYAALGKFPRNLDCSAWATWILYQGLRLYHVRDLINGENWGGGFTGTMLRHGKIVKHRANIKLGDLAIYNGHVAVCIGGGYVLSHGSPGIHKLKIDYRSDLICIRRYI